MSFRTIRDEAGTYIELPKEKIQFVSKEAEILYDLSLENDYLQQENQQLKIKYATEILKQKGITTCINWGGFQLNELDERIQDLINLSEELEKGKSDFLKDLCDELIEVDN